MKENFVVSWSPKAKESYLETILFILEKWTISEVEGFEKEAKRVVKNLSFNLKLCPEIMYKNLRKCTVSKQTSLVYRIVDKSIEIVAFIDNRSNQQY
jgi:plasmid stabilization system protein ParE